MRKNIEKVFKKFRGAIRPRIVKSVDEISILFKREKVTSVTVEPACYSTMGGLHKLTIDYTGVNGKKKPIRRQEVLYTIEKRSTDEFLLQKINELFPAIKKRAEKLQNELGVVVTIPEQFLKAFATPPPHTSRPDITI